MTDDEGEGRDSFEGELARFQSEPDRCAYLPDQTSSLLYRHFLTLSAADYERLLERGWRRHGAFFFRPGCPFCSQCRSLRVPLAAFRPTKSQRRCWRRNRDVSVEIARPSMTERHLQLFNRYHADMQRRRNWPYRYTEAVEYATSFLSGNFDFAYEFRFVRDRQIVGIGLVDLTPRVASSVYFYHDPDWRPAGPGVYSMLAELRAAEERGCRIPLFGVLDLVVRIDVLQVELPTS